MLCSWLLGPNLTCCYSKLSASLVPAAVAPAGHYLAPVRPSRVGACLETPDGVFLFLLGQEIESHLQADGLHVILAQRSCTIAAPGSGLCGGGEDGAEGPAAVMGTECQPPCPGPWRNTKRAWQSPTATVFTQGPHVTRAVERKTPTA